MADDANDRELLQQSIRNLLGLTVYSRLSDDLAKHTDDIRRDADKVTDDQLKQLEADEARLQRLLRENRERAEEVQLKLERLSKTDEQLEREVRRVTGVGADSRGDLQAQISEAEGQKRGANEEVLKLAGELLPFAISGRLCDDLRTQLEAEEKLRQWEASKARVHPQLERIINRVFFSPNSPRPAPDITIVQRTFYANRLTAEWETLFIPKPDDAADSVLHEVSPKDERFILNTLERVSAQTLGTLKELLKQRERASKRLQEASRELRNLPEDESHIGGLFDQRKANEDQKQQLNRELGKLEDEHSRLTRDLKSCQERIVNLKEKLKEADYDRSRVALARKVQDAIERYEQELQARKLARLETLTTEMYRRLARKRDFVGEVKIDPETFEVTLHDPRGRVREKRSSPLGKSRFTRYPCSGVWHRRRILSCQ